MYIFLIQFYILYSQSKLVSPKERYTPDLVSVKSNTSASALKR